MERELTESELEYLYPRLWRKRKGSLNRRNREIPRIPGARVEHGIPVQNGEVLKLIFESVNSDWDQGVYLETDRAVIVDGKMYKRGVTVFYQANHPRLTLITETREGMLWLYNVWDPHLHHGGRSIFARKMFAGMLVEELPNGYRYRCNEGRDDDDYDDLIFRIERTGIVRPLHDAKDM
jgi:hypothetical protein